jgi:transposase
MTLRLQPLPPVPEVTMAAVQAAFPKGNPYMALRAEYGALYDDQLFAELYPPLGRPVEVAPWRLALVMVMPYIEGLTDRQAADAVRRCMDWTYALSLELTDPGFDFTLWHDFRCRLLAHEAAQRLLDTCLSACKARGWLKARGTQRTDSTHVLAAIRTLHRLECVLETMHYALNQLSDVAPAWVRQQVPPAWCTRDGLRSDQARLPKDISMREALARQVGADGYQLLAWVQTADTSLASGLSPPWRHSGSSGCNHITAVPSRGSKCSVGARALGNRPRRCASPLPMTSRRATVVDATPMGWVRRCTSRRPVIQASPI